MTRSDPPPAPVVVGVGARRSLEAHELLELVQRTLDDAAINPHRVQCVATIEEHRDHPAVRGLAWPVVAFSASALAAVPTPNPSARVGRVTETTSVAEAAAILAAGPGGELVVAKRSSARATVAVARPMPESGSHVQLLP